MRLSVRTSEIEIKVTTITCVIIRQFIPQTNGCYIALAVSFFSALQFSVHIESNHLRIQIPRQCDVIPLSRLKLEFFVGSRKFTHRGLNLQLLTRKARISQTHTQILLDTHYGGNICFIIKLVNP